MLDFLKGILTPRELEELTTRLQIVKLIKKASPIRKLLDGLKSESQP